MSLLRQYSSPRGNHYLDFQYCIFVLLVPELLTNGMIESILSCVWHLQFNTVASDPPTLLCVSIGTHCVISDFKLLMIKAAVNIVIYVFSRVYKLIFVGCIARSGIAESQVGAHLALVDFAKRISKVVICRSLFELSKKIFLNRRN